MQSQKPIKWIIKHSKCIRWKMLLLILANVIFAGASVLFAFAVQGVLDGAQFSDMGLITKSAIFLVVIVASQFLFRVLINGLAERISAELEMSLKTYIFDRILEKDYGSIIKFHSGELMTRLSSDVAIVSDGVTNILPSVVSAVSRLVGAVLALVVIDWIFAIAFLVAGLMVFAIISLLRNRLKSFHKEAQRTDGVTRSYMQECIENILAIKVFSVNEKISEKSKHVQLDNFKIKMKRKNYSVLGHAGYNLIFSAGYIFALIYGGVLIYNNALSYGALLAILQLVNNVQVPFASLSNVVPKYFAMTASAERLIELELVKEELPCDKIDAKSVYSALEKVVFDKISFNYDKDTVISESSLVVNKGDFVAITGISGIGKSTLMKLLLGVYEPKDGQIYLKGDFGDLKVGNATRKIFSYVPQGNLIFSGSIRDNVTFTLDYPVSDDEIYRALKISCADEFVDSLADGLDTKIGERGLGLSEGQVQRIAIARAILSGASFILLDEATSALDENTESVILSNLKNLSDVTLIIISHKKSALSICNRHVYIENGKIVEN